MAWWRPAARRFRWQHWLLVAALLLVIAVTVWQAMVSVRHARRLRIPRDEPIAEWMPLGYVARSYHVPLPVLMQALGLPGDRPDRRPLGTLARERGQSFEEVRETLVAAIEGFRRAPPPLGTAPAQPRGSP